MQPQGDIGQRITVEVIEQQTRYANGKININGAFEVSLIAEAISRLVSQMVFRREAVIHDCVGKGRTIVTGEQQLSIEPKTLTNDVVTWFNSRIDFK